MNTSKKVQEWLGHMDYDGPIPTTEELRSVCNPKTDYVWEQVVRNVMRRETVARIRANVLIAANVQRTRRTPFEASRTSNVQLWTKRKELRQAIDGRKASLVDKENEATAQYVRIEAQHVQLERLRRRLDETQAKATLLDAKRDRLLDDVRTLDDLYAVVGTPNETDGCEDDDDNVAETLRLCVDKLRDVRRTECVVSDVQSIDTSNRSNSSYALTSTAKKSCRTQSFATPDASSYDTMIGSSSSSLVAEIKMFHRSSARRVVESLRSATNRSTLWRNVEALCIRNRVAFMMPQRDDDAARVERTDDAYEYRCIVAKLYAVDVENKLRCAQRLMRRLRCDSLDCSDEPSDVSVSFAPLESNVVAVLRDELETLRRSTRSRDAELAGVERRCNDAEAQIVATANDIVDRKLETVKVLLHSFRTKRKRGAARVSALRRFADDADWCSSLVGRYATDELRTFRDYPLSTVRRSDDDAVPPLTNVRRVLFDAWRSKRRHAMLENVRRTTIETMTMPIYERDRLKRDESAAYDEGVDDLQRLVVRAGTVGCSKRIQKLLDFWVDVPVKDYVAGGRLYDDKPYKYYENVYDRFYGIVESAATVSPSASSLAPR